VGSVNIAKTSNYHHEDLREKILQTSDSIGGGAISKAKFNKRLVLITNNMMIFSNLGQA